MAGNATSPAAAPTPAPRPVARTTVTAGETTIGAPTATDAEEAPGAVRPGAVTPVKPAAAVARAKPTRQAPTRKVLPGDLICGDCGEGNPPARNFCSRCGATLKDAAVARRRWWQRLVPRRRRKSMEAGARPWKAKDGAQKQRRRGGALGKVYLKLRPIVAGALLLAGLLVGFSPNLREKVTGRIGDAKDSVMDKLQPTYLPIQPIRTEVSVAVPEQPGSNVFDSNTLSFWLAPKTETKPFVVAHFDQPIDLERIKVWNGAAEGFRDHERVRDIHLVFDTGQSFDVVVNDLPDGQEYEIDNGKGIRSVEMYIEETYSSLAGDTLGLSEIEFYVKQ